mmetsp:Transcript_16225/g.50049  ORF Transcript_16225/g.50049 Transcript_16225/m.50049 type:complete len:260 (+) Transcript_16225:1-780(+)
MRSVSAASAAGPAAGPGAGAASPPAPGSRATSASFSRPPFFFLVRGGRCGAAPPPLRPPQPLPGPWLSMKSIKSSMSLSSCRSCSSSFLLMGAWVSMSRMTHSCGGTPALSSAVQSIWSTLQSSRKVSMHIHQRFCTSRWPPRGSSMMSVAMRWMHWPMSTRTNSFWPVCLSARTGPMLMRSGCCEGTSCSRERSSNSTYSSAPGMSLRSDGGLKRKWFATAPCALGSREISSSRTTRSVNNALWCFWRPWSRSGNAMT